MRIWDKLIENFVFGRSRLNSRVFEKLFISYSCILFIKYCALRSFCIKMLSFSKILFFQIFDRLNLLLEQLKLQLKFWFEFAWLDRCSIDARSIKCNFRSIKLVFRSIENRSKNFFKTWVFHVFFTIQLFKKLYSLSLQPVQIQSKFLSFSLNFSQRFLSSSTSKTILPFLF